MAIYMPPLVRKKKVPGHFNPDSFRVISEDAEKNHKKFENSLFHGVGRRPWSRSSQLPNIPGRETRVLPRNMPDFRANNPQPTSCKFLCHDVRLLNEPICSVTTTQTLADQPNWWHTERDVEYFELPGYTRDTCYRKDYQYLKDRWPPATSRHASNPNTEGAYGVVPVNQLGGRKHKHRLFTEKMSYEHEYNSRKEPSYPIRSRRQGHFVWNEMKGDKLQDFIDYYQKLNEYQNNEDKILTRAVNPTSKTGHTVRFNEPTDIQLSTMNTQPEQTMEQTGVQETNQTTEDNTNNNNSNESNYEYSNNNYNADGQTTLENTNNNYANRPTEDNNNYVNEVTEDNATNHYANELNNEYSFPPVYEIDWKLPRTVSQ